MASAVERLTLKRVRALDPARDLDSVSDVVVTAGRIEKIVPTRSDAVGPSEWNAEGCWLLPSFTDLRARLGQPGFEYKETIETGLTAAAAGGFSSVCALPDTAPVGDEAVVLRAMLEASRETDRSQLLPIAAATQGLKGRELSEYGELREAGAVAVSNADAYVPSASVMRRILEYALTFDMLVMQQPTEPSLADGSVMHEGQVSVRLGLRGCPSAAEGIGVERDLALVRMTGARYHMSCISSVEAVQALERAKSERLPVSADVSFANLLATDADLMSYDPNFRVHPPLRDVRHRDALLSALESGIIDAVSTNHSPQSALEKRCELDQAEAGMIGLELCLSGLLELTAQGRLSVRRMVDALAIRPAQILGRIPPRLEEGARANFVLLDPARYWIPGRTRLLSKSRNTPFLNRELRGRVLLTLADGRVVHDAREVDEC